MSSLVLNAVESYVNIGTAEMWRRHLLHHATSIWIRTTCPEPACLVSLRNSTHEVFSIDVNVCKDPMSEVLHSHPNDLLDMSMSGNSEKEKEEDAKGQRKPWGEIAGGIRVKLQDAAGNVIVAYSNFPPLADDRWHLIEVACCDGDIAFRIDQRFINPVYIKHDKLTEFLSSGLVEKPLYPAYDLIGARNASGKLQDFFCGRLSDISVTKDGFDGQKLHWWIVDCNSGRTIWDRGDMMVTQSAIHLHCCNCEWDTMSFPAPSIYFDGVAGFYAVIKDLSRSKVVQYAKQKKRSVETSLGCFTPVTSSLAIASPSASGSKRETLLEVPGVNLWGEMSVPLTPIHRGSADSPSRAKIVSPTATSINARSLETAKTLLGMISFSLWMKTTSRSPAVLLTIPLPEHVSLVLNGALTPSVGLIVGKNAFLSNADVCDGHWRQIKWLLDPQSGVSLWIDGVLTTWEPVSMEQLFHSDNTPLDGDLSMALGKMKTSGPLVGFTAFEEGGSGFFEELADTSRSNECEARIIELPQMQEVRFVEKKQTRRATKFGTIIQTDTAAEKKRSLSRRCTVQSIVTMETGSTVDDEETTKTGSERRHSSVDDFFKQCVTVGQVFEGAMRELLITLGENNFFFPFNEGSGRELQSRPKSDIEFSRERGNKSLKDECFDILTVSAPAPSQASDVPVVQLEVLGRYALWPKSAWPSSYTHFFPGQAAAVGQIAVPRNVQSPWISNAFSLAFFVQLECSQSGYFSYGQLISIQNLLVMDCRHGKILLSVADATSDTMEAVHLACPTSLLEDCEWHRISLTMSPVGSHHGMRLNIDEAPVDLAPWEDTMEDEFQEMSMGASLVQNLDCYEMVKSEQSEKELEAEGVKALSEGLAAKVKQKLVAAKNKILFSGTAQKYRTGITTGNEEMMLLDVVLGGTISGNLAKLVIHSGGKRMGWELDDNCGADVIRQPPAPDPTLDGHPSMGTIKFSKDLEKLSVRGKLREEPHSYQYSPLPDMALIFDGKSTFISAIDPGSTFDMTVLSYFSLVVWMKATSTNDQQSGCLWSLHDLRSPTLEASAGIFTHTMLDCRSSPKKRRFSPFVTSMILIDSSERTLCLQTTIDIYDGLWHKVQWIVRDAAANESSVFIDDKLVSGEENLTVVCEECPREFRGEELEMNVGARNEGDGGVNEFFVGGLRCLQLKREEQLLINWTMNEGEGMIVHDAKDEGLAGVVYNPLWELTTFPPLTPVTTEESAMEFSPATDMEEEWSSSGLVINATVKTRSQKPGNIISIASTTRKVVASFVINEGGDVETVEQEPGTHSFVIRRITVREVEDERQLSSVSMRAPVVRRQTLAPADQTPPTTALKKTKSMRLTMKEILSSCADSGEEEEEEHQLMVEKRRVRKEKIIEELKFQIHHDALIDGRWHYIRWILAPNPVECTVVIDNVPSPLLLVYRAAIKILDPNYTGDKGTTKGATREKGAAKEKPCSRPVSRERSSPSVTPPQIDENSDVKWGAFLVGKSPEHPSFRGSVKNVAVMTRTGKSLLLVPLAGDTTFMSSLPRDVATNNVKWDLSVPPHSCLFLGEQRFIKLPPIPSLDFSSFCFSIDISTPGTLTDPACILHYGRANAALLSLTVNQNCRGRKERNVLHGSVTDSEGRQLHADCMPHVSLANNEWHTIKWVVKDASSNIMSFWIDGVPQIMRYGDCCGPYNFAHLDEGGHIGALIEGVTLRKTFVGQVQKIQFADMSGETLHANWEATSGYGTSLTDSSGNRNNAMAVKPIWRTELRSGWTEVPIPAKAKDLFSKCNISCSRWSNNKNDVCFKHQFTNETMMDKWPAEGWKSGAPGPQWVTLDLGQQCTIFKIEVTMMRSSTSTHEFWLSRSNLSSYDPKAVGKGTARIPLATCVQTFHTKSASNRTIKSEFATAHHNIRWIQIVTRVSAIPVGYLSIRIFGIRGSFKETRKYSVMDINLLSPQACESLSQSHSLLASTPSARSIEDIIENAADVVPMGRTAEERAKELLYMFYTVDVDRTGYIPTEEFLRLYREQDVTGTATEDRILSELKDVGVLGSKMNFEQFRKLFTRMAMW